MYLIMGQSKSERDIFAMDPQGYRKVIADLILLSFAYLEF